MNLPADLFPGYIYWLAHALYLLLLGWALWSAPWKLLRQEGNLNILLAASVMLLLIWNLKAGIHPGLNFHVLGATLLMLMFGWQFALLSISFILLWQTAFDVIQLHSFSLNALLMGAMPSLISFAILRLSIKHLPHNFFIYVLVNGYFAAALVVMITILSASLLMLCCGPYSWETLSSKYLPFLPMIGFVEGFFTGMLTSGMVMFRPEWIGSFKDQMYLKGK